MKERIGARAVGAAQNPVNDVCQEVFKGVFTSLDRFQGTSDRQAWAWCYTIAHHKLANHFRKRGRDRLHLVDPDDLWEAIQASAQPASISPEDMEWLEHAMDLLKAAKPPCYDYLWNRYMLGWDNKMIAETFGLNYRSVHVTIKRCLETARSLATETT
jgi:RNA polymerase sigma factor (sigma-70 family)